MTTVEHFWVNDGCTVTQYTVVLDYKTAWPGKMQTAVSRNGRETKEMSKTLPLV